MSDITYDYMEEYIRSLIPDRDGTLKEIEDFCKGKWCTYCSKGNWSIS